MGFHADEGDYGKWKVKTKSKTKIQITNLDEIKEKLIRLMGKSCEKYYF